jgi:outer membrane protein
VDRRNEVIMDWPGTLRGSVIKSRLPVVLSLVLALGSLLFSVAQSETLTLREGLAMATRDNRLVEIRRREERMSRSDTAVARSKMLPTVDIAYGQTILEHQPGVVFGDQSAPTAEKSFNSYQVIIRQLIYDFGATDAFYNAAKLTEETRKLETRRTKNGVALDFTVLYLDALLADKLVAVAKKEAATLEAHLRVATALLNEGVITKNDALQAGVRLADSRQRLLAAENARKISEAALNNLLTRPLGGAIDVVEPPRPSSAVLWGEEAEAAAENERPELQELDVALRIVVHEETARRSEYFPKVYGQASYDYTRNKYVTHDSNAGISVSAKMNLFNGGSTRAEMQKLEVVRSRLRIERQRLFDDIKLELRRHFLDMTNARQRVTVAQSAISQAEENLRITRVKYAEGLGIATDVTDAITLRALSETNHYRALYDGYRSEAQYLHAMGRNLEEMYGE